MKDRATKGREGVVSTLGEMKPEQKQITKHGSGDDMINFPFEVTWHLLREYGRKEQDRRLKNFSY